MSVCKFGRRFRRCGDLSFWTATELALLEIDWSDALAWRICEDTLVTSACCPSAGRCRS